MADLGFFVGAIVAVILFRALSGFIIKKIRIISDNKKLFWAYGLAAALLFFIPAGGMTDGGKTPWAIGLTIYIPILLLFFLWDAKKADLIDRAREDKKVNWNRGIMRLWAAISIPLFLYGEFSAYTTLMDAKSGRNFGYYTPTYEEAFSNALDCYSILLFPLIFIFGIKWIIRGFKSAHH